VAKKGARKAAKKKKKANKKQKVMVFIAATVKKQIVQHSCDLFYLLQCFDFVFHFCFVCVCHLVFLSIILGGVLLAFLSLLRGSSKRGARFLLAVLVLLFLRGSEKRVAGSIVATTTTLLTSSCDDLRLPGGRRLHRRPCIGLQT